MSKLRFKIFILSILTGLSDPISSPDEWSSFLSSELHHLCFREKQSASLSLGPVPTLERQGPIILELTNLTVTLAVKSHSDPESSCGNGYLVSSGCPSPTLLIIPIILDYKEMGPGSSTIQRQNTIIWKGWHKIEQEKDTVVPLHFSWALIHGHRVSKMSSTTGNVYDSRS